MSEFLDTLTCFIWNISSGEYYQFPYVIFTLMTAFYPWYCVPFNFLRNLVVYPQDSFLFCEKKYPKLIANKTFNFPYVKIWNVIISYHESALEIQTYDTCPCIHFIQNISIISTSNSQFFKTYISPKICRSNFLKSQQSHCIQVLQNNKSYERTW